MAAQEALDREAKASKLHEASTDSLQAYLGRQAVLVAKSHLAALSSQVNIMREVAMVFPE